MQLPFHVSVEASGSLHSPCEYHSRKVVTDHTSDGSIMVSKPYEHALHCSVSFFLTSLFAVHWHVAFACDFRGHVLIVRGCHTMPQLWKCISCVIDAHIDLLSHTIRLDCTACLAHISSARCRWSMCQHGLSVVPATTSYEKFHRSTHLMVLSSSVGHMSMFGSIPVAVGRHRSPRSTEATSYIWGLGPMY